LEPQKTQRDGRKRRKETAAEDAEKAAAKTRGRYGDQARATLPALMHEVQT
jgi:hypothetical protein